MSRRQVNGIGLWVEEGGAGAPTLLLCHGLSGTGAVWDGLRAILARRWPGRWIVPDMRGHGRSDHAPLYGAAHHAADMAALTEGAERLMVVGHSMGGQAGMMLASGWFGVAVDTVIAVGVKVGWSDDDLAQANRIAGAPVRWFDSRGEAVERFLRVSGLAGIVPPDSPLAASGVTGEDGRFRLAADMRTSLVAGCDTATVHAIARARADIVLACGEGDRMATIEALRALDPEAVALAGLGHNAHVENPEAIWDLIAAHGNI